MGSVAASADAKPIGTGFGGLLRRGIGDLRQDPELRDVPFSSLVDHLADLSDVSVRTLWRWLESPEWPTQTQFEKIAKCLPKLERALACSYTYRGDWQTVWVDQSRLPPGSTLTIVSAEEKPKSMSDEGLAYRLADNVLNRKFKYIFLYPPFPEADLDDIKDTVVVLSLAALKSSGTWPNQLRSPEAHKRISASLNFLRTTTDPKSWEFWGRAPRYMVLYNVRAVSGTNYPRFGMYWDAGLSAVSYADEGEEISGWTKMKNEDSTAMYQMLEDPDSGVISENDYNEWAVPEGTQND